MNIHRIPLLSGMILALLVMPTACGGEAAPTALQVANNQPEPTPLPVATPTREATPAALLDVVGGVRIRAKSNLLFLTAEALRQDVVQRIVLIDGVSRVDSYLEVDTEPNSIVGVSPGSPLRLRGEPVSITTGEGFSQKDDEVAIPGIGVNADSYGFGMAGSMMAHRFQVGQTFVLQGRRLRVTDLYRAERDELYKEMEHKFGSGKQRTRVALAKFLEEGRVLLSQCSDEKEPPPNAQADDWAARTEAFFSEHLDESYVARFRSHSGSPMGLTSISSRDHRNLGGGINTRLARLE